MGSCDKPVIECATQPSPASIEWLPDGLTNNVPLNLTRVWSSSSGSRSIAKLFPSSKMPVRPSLPIPYTINVPSKRDPAVSHTGKPESCSVIVPRKTGTGSLSNSVYFSCPYSDRKNR